MRSVSAKVRRQSWRQATTSDGQAQTVAASYFDSFTRRDGVWKIARRRVTMQHFSPLVGITLAAPQ